jgi:hypothetical protein
VRSYDANDPGVTATRFVITYRNGRHVEGFIVDEDRPTVDKVAESLMGAAEVVSVRMWLGADLTTPLADLGTPDVELNR